MPYRRVLPRDLFNEAKLLKCLGQLALLIHDGTGIRWPLRFEHEDQWADESSGFLIDQDKDSGNIYCVNLNLYLGEGLRIHLSSNYNSKRPYPLVFTDKELGENPVLDDDGLLAREFTDYLDFVWLRGNNG